MKVGREDRLLLHLGAVGARPSRERHDGRRLATLGPPHREALLLTGCHRSALQEPREREFRRKCITRPRFVAERLRRACPAIMGVFAIMCLNPSLAGENDSNSVSVLTGSVAIFAACGEATSQ